MDDLDQRFTSRVAPIWNFETTHPNAPTEERLKACLMRESISKPYVEAQAKSLERERRVTEVLREALKWYSEGKGRGELNEGAIAQEALAKADAIRGNE